MTIGLGALKLQPATFWAMTPREFDAALEGHFGRRRRAAPARAELEALMAVFPDQIIEESTDDADHHSGRDG